MFCHESRPSVSLEVSSMGKWLLFNFIAQLLVYYFSVHEHNDDIAWMALIFTYLTTALVFWCFHRMKVARVRLNLDEGEAEWTSAVTFYVMAVVCFYAFAHLVNRDVQQAVREYSALVHTQNAAAADSSKSPPAFADVLIDGYHSLPVTVGEGEAAVTYKNEKEYVYSKISAGQHLIYAVSVLFSFCSYVYTARFGNKADDTHYGDLNA